MIFPTSTVVRRSALIDGCSGNTSSVSNSF
jgi:hypothetical protein